MKYARQRYEKFLVLVFDEPDKITFPQKAIRWFYFYSAKVDALTDLKSDQRGQVLIFKSRYIEKILGTLALLQIILGIIKLSFYCK